MTVPWVTVGSFASGLGSLYLLSRLRRHWGKPGAKWFVATIATVGVWCFTYGVALLVSTPMLRRGLEAVTWLCLVWVGFFFLAFALGYTGRTHIVGSRVFAVLGLFPVVASGLVLTNPLHALLWDRFRIASVWGVTAVEYAFEPLGYTVILVSMVFVSLGTGLVLDTVVSYGSLYRREAIAVAVSPVPPGIGVLVWALGAGPVVNLTTLLFLPHVALDTYAFVRSDMYEFHPATRRAGERAAIDDIATPVAIVDTDGRIVTLNAAAERMFDADKRALQTETLDDALVGDSFAAGETDGRLSVENGDRRHTYKVRQTDLRDARGVHLGYTVLFQDITEEIRRERRLAVLNRFLRHNVRNEGVVIRGRAELLAAELDGELAGFAETIGDAIDRLVESGDKARTLSEAGGREDRQTVAVRDLVESAVASLTDEYGGAVTVDVPADCTVETRPVLLDVVVTNLVENALEHVPDPTVTVAAAVDGDEVVLTVTDDGPGVPDHELAVLERGEETDLDHGSGVGLWLVRWAVTTLEGTLDFDAGDGTRVTVRLPRRTADAGAAADELAEGRTT
ncbi:histidine kinase N-terminal 7TM domain-containing protein [Haloarcula litorea]|uniref:sensor histidine kinase n=1 Tax=Haloarcula litorea TaxID=3032579 RepID=UPI0023E805EA|nr:histidine kinase N-terminal 7TM domain-containing protein [Halomicroarcula sp. GDY20]